MTNKREITDEEWQQYLKDKFSHVVYCLPKKRMLRTSFILGG